jgi:hypothetical protein
LSLNEQGATPRLSILGESLAFVNIFLKILSIGY